MDKQRQIHNKSTKKRDTADADIVDNRCMYYCVVNGNAEIETKRKEGKFRHFFVRVACWNDFTQLTTSQQKWEQKNVDSKIHFVVVIGRKRE